MNDKRSFRAFNGIDEFEREYVGYNESRKSEKADNGRMMDLAVGFLHADGSLR